MAQVRLWTIVAALTAFAGTCLAEDPHDKILAKAQAAGKPILFVYTRPTTCPLAKGAESHMLGSTTSKKKVRPHFIVAEIPIAEGGKRYSAYRKNFKGNFIPFWVVATPEGTYIDGGDYGTVGSGGENGWAQRLAQLAVTYPAIGEADRQTARTMIDQARTHIEASRYGQALPLAEKLKKIWYPEKLAADSRQLLEDLAEAGRKMLAEADALEKKKEFVEAALAYDRIARQFGSKSSVGKEAKKKLDALLKAHKEIQAEFRQRQRQAQAEDILARAAALEKAEEPKKARVLYVRLAYRYRDTPSAAGAAAAIKRIDAAIRGGRTSPPKDKAGDAGEAAARALVGLARTYHASGMNDKAKAKLTECVDKHAKTKSAAEARRLLAEWGLAGGE